jgi:hypothetical protein
VEVVMAKMQETVEQVRPGKEMQEEMVTPPLPAAVAAELALLVKMVVLLVAMAEPDFCHL